MAGNDMLPGFSRPDPPSRYLDLYASLWPQGSESDRLAPYIIPKTIDVDRVWTDDDPMEGDRPKLVFKYIDVARNPQFQIAKAKYVPKMIIRDEYDNFLMDASAKGQGKWRFFLTGHPGIGKSIDAVYMLCRLISKGQPVFFMPDATSVCYFSQSGVQELESTEINKYMKKMPVELALNASWLLIDNDEPVDWVPRDWVKDGKFTVWTASPEKNRMHHFQKRMDAEIWVMKPWSADEIAAYIVLMNLQRQAIMDKIQMFGPIPRHIFAIQTNTTNSQGINDIINAALDKNFLSSFSTKDGVQDASHRMFLAKPKETEDALSGNVTIDRTEFSFEFLSNFIIARTIELMGRRLENIQNQLAMALNRPDTRSVAGTFVERLLHRAFITKKMPVPSGSVFGTGDNIIRRSVFLYGQAQNFAIESCDTAVLQTRPLYLQPHAQNFAAVDAIIVTSSTVCLIQSSLSNTHSHNIATLLQIIARLGAYSRGRGGQAKFFDVEKLNLVYCLLGIDAVPVSNLVQEARKAAKDLRDDPDAPKQHKPLAALIGRQRLARLTVEGLLFNPVQDGLTHLPVV
ncbi:hypothetical protein FB45DRAFT_960648 [Roridomyces roridus]|uniref:Uncharacterized protein n=1 Tax=Roridomyces roridus TaxID=1738132 RepID=A0AAD7AXL4_9AGAR|nr:hypothetical protein FB45DRAFT_960648 [Roridomyces roridus]